MTEKILIIKHGALGDWILATGAFKLIRKQHPNAHISLLTNSQYRSLAQQCSWFDEILIDDRRGILATLKIIAHLRKKRFQIIYDLQRNQRTTLYFWLLKTPRIFWSGHVKSCAGYCFDDREKHVLDRIASQLRVSNINHFPIPDISWLNTNIQSIKPNQRYVLVIPGGSGHRPKKRWTISGYSECIEWFHQQGIQTILIGTKIDSDIIEAIMSNIKLAVTYHFYNQSLADLAELARHAVFILGSDTGPIHIAALTDTPCLVLFCSNESLVKRNKPWGSNVRTIEIPNLDDLPASKVMSIISDTQFNE